MRPLAIIEQDVAYAAQLRSVVESAGFASECFDDPNAAVREMRRRAFSLAILDLGVSNTDPFALCRVVSGFAPLITVTSESEEEVCVRAFESGADDCVVRSVAERELVARIRNVIRRADGNAPQHHLQAVSISISEMRVRVGDEVRDLTRGETELLALLLEYAPTPLTPARMAELLTSRRGTIETRIKSLRAKIGKETLISRGRLGYQLA
ncbi:MAG: response regulator transcription factor [Thermoanaerobaculia bacterium]